MEDWIERRIGAEVQVYTAKTGQQMVKLPEVAKEDREAREAQVEQFFARLPDDSFTAAEDRMRAALMNFLAGVRPGETAILSKAGTDKAVAAAKAPLLTNGSLKIALKEWIERRIGAEIELSEEPNGQMAMHLTPEGRQALPKRPVRDDDRGKGRGRDAGRDPPPREARDSAEPPVFKNDEDKERFESHLEAREAFFNSLPDNELSPAEEDFRAALLDFIGNWSSDCLPTLTEAGSDAKVKEVRQGLLPPGCHVSMKLWIDRRIGGEIETITQEGDPTMGKQIFFGLRDAIDPKMLEKALSMGPGKHNKKAKGGGKRGAQERGLTPAPKRRR